MDSASGGQCIHGNHHHSPLRDVSIISKRCFCQSTVLFRSHSQPLAATDLLPVSTDWPFPVISCRWTCSLWLLCQLLLWASCLQDSPVWPQGRLFCALCCYVTVQRVHWPHLALSGWTFGLFPLWSGAVVSGAAASPPVQTSVQTVLALLGRGAEWPGPEAGLCSSCGETTMPVPRGCALRLPLALRCSEDLS